MNTTINLPGVISSDFGGQTTHYSLGGSKILTVNEYDDPPTGYPSEVTRLYFMGMELEYDGVGNFSSTFTPKAYNFGDGRLLFDGSDIRKQYHLHDHLGNVVVVFEDKNEDGFIEETDNPNTNEVLHRYHYYSFGMLWDLPNPLTPLYSDDNRYQYNAKEFEQVANLLDYGWRWYDPVIGRWNGVDVLSEQMYAWSPYNYVFNNPLIFVDPDGRFPGLPQINAWIARKIAAPIASSTSNVRANVNTNFGGTIAGNQDRALTNLHAVSSASDKVQYDGLTNMINASDKVAEVAEVVGDAANVVTFFSGGTTAKVTGPIGIGSELIEVGAKGVKHSLIYARDGEIDTDELIQDGASFIFSQTLRRAIQSTNMHPTNSRVDRENKDAIEAGVQTIINTTKLKDRNSNQDE